MSDSLDGGCFCGSLRYRLRTAPMFVHCCHCKNCQCQTGSAFVLNALIETDRIETLSGAPEITTVESGSGKPHDIHIFTRSKLPWVSLPAKARTFEVFYETAKLRPPGSLERLRVARGSS